MTLSYYYSAYNVHICHIFHSKYNLCASFLQYYMVSIYIWFTFLQIYRFLHYCVCSKIANIFRSYKEIKVSERNLQTTDKYRLII